MEPSPQTIRSTGFKTVKKGYDPDEVELFRDQVASSVEAAQNQAAAMEARARAAVAKLQDVSQQLASATSEQAVTSRGSDDAEVLSRTLLLAQRTADSTVAEARAEADVITAHAREEASRVLDSARTLAATAVEDSREEARRALEEERVSAENEVQALLARRDFLLGDVDHLEHYMQAQRERVRDAAVQLQELVDRVPGGLGDMRRPLLSASAEPLPESLGADSSEASEVSPESVPEDEVQVEAVLEPTDPSPLAATSLDPMPLFGPLNDRSAGLGSRALPDDSDSRVSVWQLLDEEVAGTPAARAFLASSDVTAEVPITPTVPAQQDAFGIDADDAR